VEEIQQTDTQARNELGQFAPKADPVVDDVMLGNNETGQVDAFAPAGEEETSASVNELMGIPEAQQEETVTPQPETVSTPNNEEVRYEYWQSQADKAKNDLTGMREQNQLLQNQLNIINQQAQQPQVETQQEESVDFPSPPERPMKPRNYSREEAYTDPQSDSAHYLDSMDEWRDTMDEYTQLHSQYQSELARAERMDFVEGQKRQEAIREAQRQEYQQLNSVASHVKQNYNASDEDIRGFVNKFSSDDSITIDNLWRLYQMEQGGNSVQQAPVQAGSPVFEQTKRAQQVASPMGVVSGQSAGGQGSAENQIMNDLIDGYNKNNPF
tara:strand:+ start:958 stop:1935 length:978 start_codon:yes stop_codon:yes gene_type:complete